MNNHITNIDASSIKIALAKLHHKDFFITECKSGSSFMGTGNRILDALAIRKSYAHPHFIGYEIKISRSDFLRDNKIYTYLPLVNTLYLITPKGLISRDETPQDIGLMWYNPDNQSISIKKKVTPRKIEISIDMLLYIIYSRIESDRIPFYSYRSDYFKAWLDNKKSNSNLGLVVRNRMTSELKQLELELDRVSRLQKINDDKLSAYAKLIDVMHRNGYMYSDPVKWLEYRLVERFLSKRSIARKFSLIYN